MNAMIPKRKFRNRIAQGLVALLCSLLLAPGDTIVYAQQQDNSADAAGAEAPRTISWIRWWRPSRCIRIRF